MATSDDRTEMIEAQERLLDLLFQLSEANAIDDREEAAALKPQIAAARRDHDRLRDWSPGPRDDSGPAPMIMPPHPYASGPDGTRS